MQTFYKVKSPTREFFCAHCRSPRGLKYQRQLRPRHFLQMMVLTIVATMLLFPWMQWKSVALFFLFWAMFDIVLKMLYRKDLKCPYCGFDPTWYRRDVRVARRQVEQFLKENPQTPILKNRTFLTSEVTHSNLQ
jgi:hypothetical protein